MTAYVQLTETKTILIASTMKTMFCNESSSVLRIHFCTSSKLQFVTLLAHNVCRFLSDFSPSHCTHGQKMGWMSVWATADCWRRGGGRGWRIIRSRKGGVAKPKQYSSSFSPPSLSPSPSPAFLQLWESLPIPPHQAIFTCLRLFSVVFAFRFFFQFGDTDPYFLLPPAPCKFQLFERFRTKGVCVSLDWLGCVV